MRFILFAAILVFVLFSVVESAQIKRLSGDHKPQLTAAQVRELEQKESEKHPVDGYVSVQTVVNCFDEMSYQYTGGRYQNTEIKFRLRQPNNIKPGKKYPLIVGFHGKGESDDDNRRQLAHLQHTIEILAGPKSLDFFMLSTQCPKDNSSWTTSVSMEDGKGDAPMTIAREIMEVVIREFPIDEDRISVVGLSSGGTAAWQFAMDSPERFASLVACSATPPPGPILKDVNVWVFGCTDDKGISIDQLRETVKRTNDGGGSALLTERKSSSHDSWTEALNRKKAVAWMVSQKRNSWYNPPPGSVLMPKTWGQSLAWFGPPIFCIILLFFVRVKQQKC